MALVAAPPNIVINVADHLSMEQRLLRFLRTGTESNFYLPGKNKNYRLQSSALRAMLDANEGLAAVECIKRVNREKSYLKRDPLLYNLAVACLFPDIPVKRAAYRAVLEVCRNTGEMFTYLEHMKSINVPRSRWGAGLRKTVCDWYNNQDAMVLADLISRHQALGRWSHRDVFRMSHIIPANEGIGFVVKTVIKGLKIAKESRPDPCPIVKSLIKFYDAIDFVRHTSDATAAAIMMDEHGLDIDQIPTTLLHSKEVWNSLLTKMSLHDTLFYLRALARRKLLTTPKPADVKDPILIDIQKKVLQKVKDVEAIQNEQLSPYFIYQMVRNYTNEYGPRKHIKLRMGPHAGQKRSASGKGGGPHTKRTKHSSKGVQCQLQEDGKEMDWNGIVLQTEEKAAKNNPELFGALEDCYWIALDKNMPSTGKRFLVALSLSENGNSNPILGAPSMTVSEVMAMTAQFILKKEKSTELGFFEDNFIPVKCPTISKMVQMVKFVSDHMNKVDLAQEKDGSGDLMAPLVWALENKKEIDVFLIMCDHIRFVDSGEISEKFYEYKTAMNLPDTKMVLYGLKSQRLHYARGDSMFDIGGFDHTAPELMYKFLSEELDQ